MKAVTGRDVLGAGEMGRMIYCRNVISFYHEKHRKDEKGNENWAKWAQDNPGPEAVLNEAMLAAGREDENNVT